MKKLLIFTTLLIICYSSFGQGLFGRTYSKGYYYDKSGQKIEGLINARADYRSYIYYKKEENAKMEKIYFKNFLSVVSFKKAENSSIANQNIAERKDSLSVQSTKKLGKRLYLAIAAVEKANVNLYYRTYPASVASPTMTVNAVAVPGSRGTQPAFTNQIGWRPGYGSFDSHMLMYEKDGATFEVTRSNYKEILKNAFSAKPEIIAMIAESKYREIGKIIDRYNTDMNKKEENN